MAKNRNKKKKNNGAVPMDTVGSSVIDLPQAMDTSGPGDQSKASSIGKIKKGRPMKRSKNVRKMKAIAKAISKNERIVEKITKNESKTVRTQTAKMLYD
ncbi:Stress response protein [Quillaja saponaria]|uniref:Stress response protein n=1 Tax=Quillaja saponaria TaxID=32244 RepID=A0AAD7KZ44_QUISA|nr:Stress response protein [Quillaja saponaria]